MKRYLLLMATVIMAALMLVVTANAEITLSYDLSTEEVEGETLSVVTATLVDPDSVFFEIFYNEIAFDNSIMVPADYEYGTAIESTDPADLLYCMQGMVSGRNKAKLVEPSWKVEGTTTTFELDSYYDGTKAVDATAGLEVFKFYFLFVDGKSEADFTPDSFKVKRVLYQDDNVMHGFKYNDYNDMVVTNNVVPAADPIYITVAAGDKVYLQDGSVVTIETAGEYEVPADVGYVLVDSGNMSAEEYEALKLGTDSEVNKVYQKTYYVNGTGATVVHDNSIVSIDGNGVRGPEPDDNETKGKGVRFKMGHNPGGRSVAEHKIDEIGFIMTVDTKVVNDKLALNEMDFVLNWDMVKIGAAKYGTAYDKSGKNIAYSTDIDNFFIITGVFFGIPDTEAGVTTKIHSRPYYKIGDTFIYGEVTVTTLYDEAQKIKDNTDLYEGLSAEHKAYVDNILFLVDGTEIIEDEVIIDVGELYN